LARLARGTVLLRILAVAVLLGACAYSISIAPSFAWVVVAAASAAALLLVVRPRAWGRNDALRAGAGAALAAVALFAVPARTSIQLVGAHATDGGQLGLMAARDLNALSGYLAPRTRGAKYELAVTNYTQAASLIVRDVRPIMILENVEKRPMTSLSVVRAAAERGQVRYVLIGGSCGVARNFQRKHCSAGVRWARAHSVDVTAAAGLGSRGYLFELRPHGLTRSQHGGRTR
jgi:hypothetical protein